MKSEREKMLAGEPYDPLDSELQSIAKKSRQLVALLQNIAWDDEEARHKILSQLLGKASIGCWIEAPFFCDYGNNIYMAENSYVNANCVFLDCADIIIGKGVLIAPAVQLYAVTHPINPEARMCLDPTKSAYHSYAKPITIGDYSWIGGGSIVLPGVNIGKGVTIGAGSVVTKDIPDRVLAYGNPCRVIKKL